MFEDLYNSIVDAAIETVVGSDKVPRVVKETTATKESSSSSSSSSTSSSSSSEEEYFEPEPGGKLPTAPESHTTRVCIKCCAQ